MLNEVTLIGDALLNDSAVSAIVGENVYQEESPVIAKFPQVVYSLSRAPSEFADNQSTANAFTLDVDAFCFRSAFELSAAVISCIESLGYICTREQSAGMTGADGTVQQVSMTFTITKEA